MRRDADLPRVHVDAVLQQSLARQIGSREGRSAGIWYQNTMMRAMREHARSVRGLAAVLMGMMS